MAFLTPDTVNTYNFGNKILTIKSKIIPNTATASKNVAAYVPYKAKMKPCRLLDDGKGTVKGITIHNTDYITCSKDTTPAEQYTRATWPNCNMSGVIVHYYVDDKCVWQNLADNEQGWHAADGASRRQTHIGAKFEKAGGNLDTIAMEIIGAESEDNGAMLTALLLKRHGLTIKDVYTHNYWMYGSDTVKPNARKNCPVYILAHWDKFLAKVQEYLDTLQTSNDDGYIYRVQVGAYKNKSGAETLLSNLKKDGYNGFITKVKQ